MTDRSSGKKRSINQIKTSTDTSPPNKKQKQTQSKSITASSDSNNTKATTGFNALLQEMSKPSASSNRSKDNNNTSNNNTNGNNTNNNNNNNGSNVNKAINSTNNASIHQQAKVSPSSIAPVIATATLDNKARISTHSTANKAMNKTATISTHLVNRKASTKQSKTKGVPTANSKPTARGVTTARGNPAALVKDQNVNKSHVLMQSTNKVRASIVNASKSPVSAPISTPSTDTNAIKGNNKTSSSTHSTTKANAAKSSATSKTQSGSHTNIDINTCPQIASLPSDKTPEWNPLTQQIQNEQQAHNNTKQELDRVKSLLAAAQDKKQDMVKTIKEQQNKIAAQTRKASDDAKQIYVAECKIQCTETELAAKTKALDAKIKEIARKNKQIKVKKKELDDKNSKLNDIKLKYSQLKKKCEGLEKEITSRSTALRNERDHATLIRHEKDRAIHQCHVLRRQQEKSSKDNAMNVDALKNDIHQKEILIKELGAKHEQVLIQKEAQIKGQQAQIVKLKTELQEKEEHIKELGVKHDNAIKERDAQIKTQQAQIVKLKTDLHQKEETITELSTNQKQLQTKITSLQEIKSENCKDSRNKPICNTFNTSFSTPYETKELGFTVTPQRDNLIFAEEDQIHKSINGKFQLFEYKPEDVVKSFGDVCEFFNTPTGAKYDTMLKELTQNQITRRVPKNESINLYLLNATARGSRVENLGPNGHIKTTQLQFCDDILAAIGNGLDVVFNVLQIIFVISKICYKPMLNYLKINHVFDGSPIVVGILPNGLSATVRYKASVNRPYETKEINTRLEKNKAFIANGVPFEFRINTASFDPTNKLYLGYAIFAGYVPSIKIKQTPSELKYINALLDASKFKQAAQNKIKSEDNNNNNNDNNDSTSTNDNLMALYEAGQRNSTKRNYASHNHYRYR